MLYAERVHFILYAFWGFSSRVNLYKKEVKMGKNAIFF